MLELTPSTVVTDAPGGFASYTATSSFAPSFNQQNSYVARLRFVLSQYLGWSDNTVAVNRDGSLFLLGASSPTSELFLSSEERKRKHRAQARLRQLEYANSKEADRIAAISREFRLYMEYESDDL